MHLSNLPGVAYYIHPKTDTSFIALSDTLSFHEALASFHPIPSHPNSNPPQSRSGSGVEVGVAVGYGTVSKTTLVLVIVTNFLVFVTLTTWGVGVAWSRVMCAFPSVMVWWLVVWWRFMGLKIMAAEAMEGREPRGMREVFMVSRLRGRREMRSRIVWKTFL
jgi:hypothetical protein